MPRRRIRFHSHGQRAFGIVGEVALFGDRVMAELTLETLAKRVEALEKKLAEQEAERPARKKDWRRVIGISEDNDFTRLMRAEIEAAREADRRAGREGQQE